MRIQAIYSNNNTNFGYNRNLNNELLATIEHAKRNKAYAQYIGDLCNLTNKAEDAIRKAEKKNSHTLAEQLITAFLPIKVLLSSLVDSLYPDLSYSQREIESYTDELEENTDNKTETQADNIKHSINWRASVIASLKLNKNNDENTKIMQKAQNILRKNFPNHEIAIEIGDENETTPKGYYYNMNDDDELSDDDFYMQDDIDDEKPVDGKDKVIPFEPKGEALKGFAGLGGMEQLKELLNDKVVDFLKNPAQAIQDNKDYGTQLPNAILFYGPPGCGKTTIIQHLSTEAGVPLFELRPGVFGSTLVNGTEQNIEAAFNYVASIATEEKPAIMFIDDIDMILGSRDNNSTTHKQEELGTFLNRIQDAHSDNTLVIAATNKFDKLDTAVKRRFDQQVYVGLPDREARIALLKFFLQKNNKGQELAKNEKAIETFADKLKSFPNSAIKQIVYDACDIPRKEAKEARQNGQTIRRNVTADDIEKIINLPETQNKAINENMYKTTDATRKKIGY